MAVQNPIPVISRVLVRFSPLPTQTVVALVLGVGRAAGRWAGLVHLGNRTVPLDEVRLVGPGMRCIRADGLDRNPTRKRGNNEERWSRTRGALGQGVWTRLHRSSAAVIGAGRNGSACAYSLAMLGIGRLVLIDPDVEQLHNLDAAVGSRPRDVGCPKVENRKKRICEMP